MADIFKSVSQPVKGVCLLLCVNIIECCWRWGVCAHGYHKKHLLFSFAFDFIILRLSDGSIQATVIDTGCAMRALDLLKFSARVGRLHRRPAATARYPIKQNGQRSFNAHTQKRTHHRFFIDYTISLITRTWPWVGLTRGLGRVWSGMGPKFLLQWVGLAHGSKSSLGTRSGLVGSRIGCVWSG